MHTILSISKTLDTVGGIWQILENRRISVHKNEDGIAKTLETNDKVALASLAWNITKVKMLTANRNHKNWIFLIQVSKCLYSLPNYNLILFSFIK